MNKLYIALLGLALILPVLSPVTFIATAEGASRFDRARAVALARRQSLQARTQQSNAGPNPNPIPPGQFPGYGVDASAVAAAVAASQAAAQASGTPPASE